MLVSYFLSFVTISITLRHSLSSHVQGFDYVYVAIYPIESDFSVLSGDIVI